jgi:hypothetical protein
MAIAYSYPTATPEIQDLLVGTEMVEEGGEGTPRTRTFTVGSIVELASNGVAGPRGPQGLQGLTGPQGEQGEQGIEGPQGIEGEQGEQGLRGVQGVEGPQGIAGIAGIQGETGPTGTQGIQGAQGLLGPVGPAGLNWRGAWTSETSYIADDAVGYNGASWFCKLATSGTITPDLDTTNWALLASQGAQGQAGLNGAAGAAGPTGAQGTAGQIGTQGPQGAQGIQGNQGIQGIQGIKGDQGNQGMQGNQGTQGPQGIQGPAGVDGAVGPAGLEWRGPWALGTSYIADDAVGYNGASYFCILATSGSTPPNLDANWALLASQGAQGVQGAQGIQGLTGAQGSSGSLTPITASAPLTGGTITTTGVIGISVATNLTDGYITKETFATFNGKANVNSQTFTGTPSLPIGATGVTQVAGTNNTTLATTEFVATAANNRLVTETTSGHILTNADSGGIIIFKTTVNQTLTMPATSLAAGFECTFVTLAGVTLTVIPNGNILNNAIGTLLPPQSSFTLKRMMAANTFIATGNL